MLREFRGQDFGSPGFFDLRQAMRVALASSVGTSKGFGVDGDSQLTGVPTRRGAQLTEKVNRRVFPNTCARSARAASMLTFLGLLPLASRSFVFTFGERPRLTVT
jgi:hypothetical protein